MLIAKKANNNPKKCGKHKFLRMIAMIVILSGLGYASTNLYHFSKGYFAEWIYTSGVQATEFNSPSINTDVYPQTSAGLTAEQAVNPDSEVPDKIGSLDVVSESVVYEQRPETGVQFGELYIPKLDATLPIFEGTEEDELDLGVGHFADSVLPGERDNCVLAGHRDTVFRRLGEVGEGDSLIVRTSVGEFEYVVNKVRIVDLEDRTVIVPKPKATLTVSTCYPFEYIGSAPQRYILVAYLASSTLK